MVELKSKLTQGADQLISQRFIIYRVKNKIVF